MAAFDRKQTRPAFLAPRPSFSRMYFIPIQAR